MRLLVLRPEPGASETAARAREAGLDPLVVPLFAVAGVDAAPPADRDYDSVLLTSANGARFAPPGITSLPCFAVGEASAAAARAAGFVDVRVGPSDGEAALRMLAESGAAHALHPCGRHHKVLSHPEVRVDRLVVYASEPVDPPSLAGPAVALLHSPRAAARFAEVVEDKASILIAAISEAAAAAAGGGWGLKAVAREPRDAALLELAVKLCNYAPVTAKEGDDGI